MNEQNVPKRKTAWLKYGVIAGCVVLLLGLGFGVYTIAKSKEKGATASGVPSTGATETTQTTQATEPATDTKPPEDDQSTEEPTDDGYVYVNPDWMGFYYHTGWIYSEPSVDTKVQIVGSYVERYNGETCLWRSSTITDYRVENHFAVSDGVIISGHTDFNEKPSYRWIAKVSDTGEILWQYRLEITLTQSEYVVAVIENTDGTYSVFTACPPIYFNMHKFSADGQHILFQKNEVEDKEFGCVAAVGDGYWVQLSRIESHIVQLDNTGKITGTLDLEKENFNYDIKDMIEYNGKVYISANVTPNIAERAPENLNRLEMLDLFAMIGDWRTLDYTEENGEKSADITDMYKNHYTAVLLACDTDSGTFREVCTVKESKGRNLTINDAGDLVWETKEITQATLTPGYGSRNGYVSWRLLRWHFDNAGEMIEEEKTNIKYSESI